MSESHDIYKILSTAMVSRSKKIGEYLAARIGYVVHSGPFQGMNLSQATSWERGVSPAKIIGCYEAQLHAFIEQATARAPEVVVNIGCAEGYYAVGLARRLPHAPVYAFDTDPAAQKVCRLTAELNGVQDRVRAAGFCDPAALISLVQGKRALVVIDCEGGEKDLMTPAVVAALSLSDIIIENHDFLDRSISQKMANALSASHDVTIEPESGRNPASYPFMQRLSHVDQLVAICEFRPEVMTWTLATSKAAVGA